MKPFEPKVTIVHREANRLVEIYVTQMAPTGYEHLTISGVDDDGTQWVTWEHVDEAVAGPPFMVLSEEVFAALRATIVGDKLEEREFLRGRLQETQESLNVERNRVDLLIERLMP